MQKINKQKDNWQTKKLDEVCNIINGSTPLRSKKDFWHNGTINWFTIEDIRNQGRIIKETKQKISEIALNKTSLRILPPKSILLCCTASIGEYAINEIPLTTNQQFNGLVIKNQKILDPFFLYYFSATLKDQLSKLSGKTTIDFIPISRLKEIKISFPSILEQQDIVKILDEFFEGVDKAKENAKKNLQNARELFESCLQNVFSNPGDVWEGKKLGEVCDIVNGGTPKTNILEYWNGDILWVTPKDMGKMDTFFLADTERKISEAGLKNSSAKIIPSNSVILSTRAPIGHLAINKKVITTNQGCKGLIPNNNLNVYFLFYFLKLSVDFLNNLGSGTTFKELSSTKLKEVEIPLPSFSEQQRIVTKLDSLSEETKKLENIYKQKLTDLEEIKESILKKAFSGEL